MKILYGVAGEGAGHAIRSKTLLAELQKQHKIIVAAGGKAYPILSKLHNTIKIESYRLVYRKNTLSFLTFFHVLLKIPLILLSLVKLTAIMLKFKPDVVITDFEPVSCYAAILLNKKCISIDNQHIINTRLNIKTNTLNKLVLWLAVKSIIPKANHRLVTTFFYPPVHKKRTHLFPTINRKEILNVKSKQGSHILVYQTSKSNKKLLPALRQLPYSFVVYGFDKDKKIGNVQFRKFDEKGFIKDISGCKAVITNGGFTVIGEALHLQKPILSVPVKKQFEQIINAIYLERLGYGKCYKHTNKKNIQEFLSNLSHYQKNIKKYKPQDNSKITAHLNQILQKIYK